MFKIGDIVTPDFDDGFINDSLVKNDFYKVVELEHTNESDYAGGYGCRVIYLKTGKSLGWYTTQWFKPVKEHKVKMLLDKLSAREIM